MLIMREVMQYIVALYFSVAWTVKCSTGWRPPLWVSLCRDSPVLSIVSCLSYVSFVSYHFDRFYPQSVVFGIFSLGVDAIGNDDDLSHVDLPNFKQLQLGFQMSQRGTPKKENHLNTISKMKGLCAFAHVQLQEGFIPTSKIAIKILDRQYIFLKNKK